MRIGDFDRVHPRLYQGGAVFPHLAYPGFTMVVLCADDHQVEMPRFRGKVVHAPFDDHGRMPMDERDRMIAHTAALRVAREIMREGRVLVTCAAGMNRSGLVTGLALIRLTRWSVDEIVGRIRRARMAAAQNLGYPRALHNDAFVAELRRAHADHASRRRQAA